MNGITRALRYRRFLASFALTGLTILSASGASGTSDVIPGTQNSPTGLNSSPSTSAGTFPNDITRFSQSSALTNPKATPTPLNPRLNQGIVPFGNPTPNPAANPRLPQ
jgi:hypothetical protein